MCVKQLEEGRAEVENQYARAVRREGNVAGAAARRARSFEVVPRKWRGIGEIPRERPRPAPRRIARFDAELRFGVGGHARRTSRAECISGLDPAGQAEAARVPGLRHALHARASARRHDGLLGGRVRRLLPLSPRPARARSAAGADAMSTSLATAFQCPLPIGQRHARPAGARRRRPADAASCIEQLFLPAFGNPRSAQRHDGARLRLGGAALAFTTDSYVVRPLFFPAATSARWRSTARSTIWPCAARGRSVSSAGFILEEGLPMETLARVVQSMRRGREAAGVSARHRRHQGRRSRQGRRRLHQHGRHRR